MRNMKFDNRAHKMDYKRWHKCARCEVFTLFDDEPSKTTFVCPDCWKVWKDLPQYRIKEFTKRGLAKQHARTRGNDPDWPIEYMLAYGLVCSLSLLIIAYYLFWK